MTKKTLFAAALAAGIVGFARAEDRAWAWSPLGIGIAAPIQLPLIDSDVYGLRFGGLFGYNADMFGIDAGVVSLETGTMAGIQGAAFTWTSDSVYGIQGAFLANVVDGDVFGVQVASVNADWGNVWGVQVGVVDYCNSFHGIQVGGINWNNTPSHGWQTAVANANQEEFAGFSAGAVNYSLRVTGCQIGAVNLADSMTGCQIGFFNAAQRARGVQIGFLNMICEGPLPIMVVANASF
jgi:hypothetical protein